MPEMGRIPNNIAVFLCKNRWLNRYLKGFNDQKGWVHLKNGFKFFIYTGDISGPSFLTARKGFDNYEPENRTILEGYLTGENSVFIDIGANIGNFSISAFLNNPKIKILAFEPMPFLNDCLYSTIKANKISNIELLPYALSDKAGKSKLFMNDVNSGNHSLLRSQIHPEASDKNWVYVKAKKLDDLLPEYNIDRIDAIKIDAEGYELPVVKGSINSIANYKPSMLIECRNSLLIEKENIGQVLQQISGTNYRFKTIWGSDFLPLGSLGNVARSYLDQGSGHTDYLFVNFEN